MRFPINFNGLIYVSTVNYTHTPGNHLTMLKPPHVRNLTDALWSPRSMKAQCVYMIPIRFRSDAQDRRKVIRHV